MKLNHDCIRDILLAVERLQTFELRSVSGNFMNRSVSRNVLERDLANWNSEDVCYAVLILEEARYIVASVTMAGNNVVNYSIHRLTYNGHEYLESIRDGKVWEKLKSVMVDVGVSTFDAIKQTAIKVFLANLQDLL
jgi:hypothetical protein